MIEKLDITEVKSIELHVADIEFKLNEIIDEINDLGGVIDDYTGSAPKFRRH